MSAEPTPTCRDFLSDVDGFVDGELDARSMRASAAHTATCASCDAEAKGLEDLQGAIARTITAEVDRVDPAALWRRIEQGIATSVPAGIGRLPSLRRRARSVTSRWGLPALAAAAAALVLFVASPLRQEPVAGTPLRVANNHARIDRIESSSPHVMVWSEPEEHTTAIWVASYEP